MEIEEFGREVKPIETLCNDVYGLLESYNLSNQVNLEQLEKFLFKIERKGEDNDAKKPAEWEESGILEELIMNLEELKEEYLRGIKICKQFNNQTKRLKLKIDTIKGLDKTMKQKKGLNKYFTKAARDGISLFQSIVTQFESAYGICKDILTCRMSIGGNLDIIYNLYPRGDDKIIPIQYIEYLHHSFSSSSHLDLLSKLKEKHNILEKLFKEIEKKLQYKTIDFEIGLGIFDEVFNERKEEMQIANAFSKELTDEMAKREANFACRGFLSIDQDSSPKKVEEILGAVNEKYISSSVAI